MDETLSNDQLAREIALAFPASAVAPTDAFIEANPDVLRLSPPVDLMVFVPAYLSWCVRHDPENRGTLVPDHTVRALGEFGRSRDSTNSHLNFMHTCSERQRNVIASFLRWCLNPDLILDTEHVKRALKYWQPRAGGGANAV
jgi:hypothetical protein